MTSQHFPLASQAVVSTDRPERYRKQLVSHLGRKLQTREADDGHWVEFDHGRCRLTCNGDSLVLDASAADHDWLEQVQGVVGRHLEQFGARDALVVGWQT